MRFTESLLAVFTSQYGVASIDQMVEHGLSRRTVERARSSRELFTIAPGVVALAGTAETHDVRSMAAQLHIAPDGMLSGFTSAHHLGVRGMPTSRIYVTSTIDHRRERAAWISYSMCSWRNDDDTVTHRGLLLEAPHPMMFTLAARCNDHRFERVAEDAWRLGLITPDSLRDYVERWRRQGRSGVARINRWLQQAENRRRPMQSGFEVLMVQALRAIGMPEPVKQHRLITKSGEPIHIDVAYPDVRLAIEPGHSWFHGGELGRRSDEARRNACVQLGWSYLSFGEEWKPRLHQAAQIVADSYRELSRSHRPAAAF